MRERTALILAVGFSGLGVVLMLAVGLVTGPVIGTGLTVFVGTMGLGLASLAAGVGFALVYNRKEVEETREEHGIPDAGGGPEVRRLRRIGWAGTLAGVGLFLGSMWALVGPLQGSPWAQWVAWGAAGGPLVAIGAWIPYGRRKRGKVAAEVATSVAEDLGASGSSFPLVVGGDGVDVTVHRARERQGRYSYRYRWTLTAPTGDTGTRVDVEAENMLSGASDALGAEDVQLGHDGVDEALDVRTNDEERLRRTLPTPPPGWEEPRDSPFARFTVDDGTVAYEWVFPGSVDRPTEGRLREAVRFVSETAQGLSEASGRAPPSTAPGPTQQLDAPLVPDRWVPLVSGLGLAALSAVLVFAVGGAAWGWPPGTGIVMAGLLGFTWFILWAAANRLGNLPLDAGERRLSRYVPWAVATGAWTVAALAVVRWLGTPMGEGSPVGGTGGIFLMVGAGFAVLLTTRQIQRVRLGTSR